VNVGMGMTFSSLGLAIIAVSMFALAMTGLMVDLSSKYGVPVNQSYPETYNKMQQILNDTNQIGEAVTGDAETSALSQSDALLQQGGAAIKTSFGGISLIGAMLRDVSNFIGLPTWFVGGVIAMIIVVLGWLGIAILNRLFFKP
jgi:hypothetical protein